MSYSQALSSAGSAVSDLFGSEGSSAAAASYSQAAQIAEANVGLAQQQTQIQETQEARQIYQTIGAEQSQVGGAGLSASGSALDILRSSQSQGALTKAMTAEQGAITENSYAEQAGLYSGLAGAANASATGELIGGVIQAGGSGYALYNAYNAGSATAATAGSSALAGSSADAAATTTAGSSAILEGSTDAAGDAAISAGADDAAGDAAISAGADDAAGDGFLDAVGSFVTDAAASWVICTELNRQGKLPNRLYVPGARRFAEYDERTKPGYYIWAIPSVRHLRTHPESRYSRFLEWIFNHRAEYIAAQSGLRNTHKTIFGFLALTGMYALCWILSRTVARTKIDWTILYRKGA